MNLWVEKYRPKVLKNMVLLERTQSVLAKYIKDGDLPHLLFAGIQGTGKTTTGKVIANEMKANFMYLNGSKEKSIDVLRTKITKFIMKNTITNTLKIVFIDELDGVSSAYMEALKVDIEQYSKTTRFIFGTNNISKIIAPLKSRTVAVDIVPTMEDEKKEFAMMTLKRIEYILKSENVKYDKKFLISIIKKFFPDIRQTITLLQRLSKEYDGDLTQVKDNVVEQFISKVDDNLFKILRSGSAKDVLKKALELNGVTFFRDFSRKMIKHLEDESILDACIILSDYESKMRTGCDEQITLKACLSEMKSELKFK